MRETGRVTSRASGPGAKPYPAASSGPAARAGENIIGPDRTGEDHTGQNHTREDHTGQDHTREDHTGQDHTREDHTGQDHTGQDHTGQDHTGQNHTREDGTGQDGAGQSQPGGECGAELAEVAASAAGTDASPAVLTVLRLFRSLERVDAGLTPQQYLILKLAGAGGERSARLAERLAVAKPTLTTTADGLVAAGYLRRGAEAGDRRVVRLCLTPAGHEALRRADATYSAWLDRLLGAMDEADQALVSQALAVLDTTMDDLRRARQAGQRPAKQRDGAEPPGPGRPQETAKPREETGAEPARPRGTE